MGKDLGVFDKIGKTAKFIGLVGGFRGRQPDGRREPGLAEKGTIRHNPDQPSYSGQGSGSVN